MRETEREKGETERQRETERDRGRNERRRDRERDLPSTRITAMNDMCSHLQENVFCHLYYRRVSSRHKCQPAKCVYAMCVCARVCARVRVCLRVFMCVCVFVLSSK